MDGFKKCEMCGMVWVEERDGGGNICPWCINDLRCAEREEREEDE